MAKVLIVIPHDRFRDEEFSAVFETLKKAGHEVMVGSTHHTEAQGHFGLLVKPDINISFVEQTDYDCFVFIGGLGVQEFILNSAVADLIRNAYYERKLLCAIGMAVGILVYAGILSGKKITCDTATIPLVEGAGGYYTGRLVEQDGELITAAGIDASADFAEEIVSALKWRDERKAPIR